MRTQSPRFTTRKKMATQVFAAVPSFDPAASAGAAGAAADVPETGALTLAGSTQAGVDIL